MHHSGDGFSAEITGFGTLIIPAEFCEQNGITDLADATQHVVREMLARGIRIVIKVDDACLC